MTFALRQAVDQVDRVLARFSLAAFGDDSSLIIPMFHGVYPDRKSTQSNNFDPQQRITLDQFRAVVSTFADAGFRFIRPEHIDSGLSPGRYVMLTFDDGYFNNVSVLPILEEFEAPAVFFISASHVQTGKAFWWDVLYRLMRRSNRSDAELDAARARCKSMPTDQAENWIKAEFKLDRFHPASDLDRPMTPAELRSLARSKYAVIGNHTLNHAILTNYTSAGVRDQIQGGQDALYELTGARPTCIAYPNGNHSPQIVQAALDAGLTTGVVAHPGWNSVPIPASDSGTMTLRRVVPWGNKDISSQCTVFRSRYSLYRSIAGARGARSAPKELRVHDASC